MLGSSRYLLLAALCGGCIAPSVVDSSGRAVEAAPTPLNWAPAQADQLDGLFESLSIEGDAAQSLWRVSYHFVRTRAEAATGTYSGAALVIGGASPQFQTLSGEWSLSNGRLEFSDGSGAQVFASGEWLKLASDGGAVVLRKAAIQ
jgi:hypothetical protein